MNSITHKIDSIHEEIDELESTPTGQGIGEITEVDREQQINILQEELATLTDSFA